MKKITEKFKQTEIGILPEQWDVRTIDSIANIIGGGTPKTTVDEYWGGDIPWLSVVDFGGDARYVYNTEKMITKVGLENSSTRILDKGMLIISARGTVGEMAQLGKPMAFNQSCYGLSAKQGISNDFLYYLLRQSISSIKQKTHGAVFDTITRDTFKSIFVPIPSVQEQKQIAKILSSLDDKIELNHRMNKTLEEMAQALFKRWFVDFEFPDEEGKPYKSSGGKMVESEIGLIPETWRSASLGEFFPVVTGKMDANVSLPNGKYPFFSCSQGVLRTNEFSFDSSSLLLAGNGDFNVKWYEGKFEAYQRTYVLTPYNKQYLGLLFYLVKHFLNDITAGHRGSVIRFITKGMIENFKVVIPEEGRLEQMAIIFNEINRSIDFYTRETESLSQIRDFLLPRLMSGKIRVN